jgi:hypothetical protein
VPGLPGGILSALTSACLRENWSQWRESNPRPIDYKSIALPLSYTGSEKEAGLCEIRRKCQTRKTINRVYIPDGDASGG